MIEDCAHALGARYRGRAVGTLGDAAIFSFQTLKPLNAYGGGMAVVSDPQLGARVAALAAAEPAIDLKTLKQRFWHGRVLRIATRPSIFKWTLFPLMYACTRLHWDLDMYFWEQIRPLDPMPRDYRQRFSNVQAAIALEGLGFLDEWSTRTQKHAERMSAVLRQVPGVRVPETPADRTHAFYQYCAYVPERDGIVDACLQARHRHRDAARGCVLRARTVRRVAVNRPHARRGGDDADDPDPCVRIADRRASRARRVRRPRRRADDRDGAPRRPAPVMTRESWSGLGCSSISGF